MTTFYVATTGNDGASGTEASPVRNISRAMSLASAGDTVLVADGTYTEGLKPNMIEMKAGVTLKAANLRGARLQTPSYCYAVVNMASNSTVDGFDIGGVFGHGLFANGLSHIKQLNNRIIGGFESGCGGMKSDFITIEGNEVSCPHLSTWGSGISIYEPEAKALNSGEAEPAFRIIVRNNISHHNFQDGGPFTDGNGIIMDDFQHWQNDPKVNYNRAYLVENNLCYENGGKGIAIHWSDNGVIRNNTCINNNRDNKNTTGWRGDISQQDAPGCRFERNLAISGTANAANRGFGCYGGNANTQWNNNATDDADADLGDTTGPVPGTGNLYSVDAALVDFVPTNPALDDIGWRPNGAVIPPVEPPVDPPVAPDDLSPFATMTPADIVTEAQAYELGTKIVADKPGKITALRLYRTNSNAQTVRLWKGTQRVAAGTISGGTGWAELAVDVPAVAGDAFIVSVGKSSAQKYATTVGALSSAVQGDGFTLPANGGVFATTVGQLPTQVWNASYYWVDVRFAETVVTPEPEPDMEARVAELEEKVATQAAEIAALQAAVATQAAALTLAEGKVEQLEAFDARLRALE